MLAPATNPSGVPRGTGTEQPAHEQSRPSTSMKCTRQRAHPFRQAPGTHTKRDACANRCGAQAPTTIAAPAKCACRTAAPTTAKKHLMRRFFVPRGTRVRELAGTPPRRTLLKRCSGRSIHQTRLMPKLLHGAEFEPTPCPRSTWNWRCTAHTPGCTPRVHVPRGTSSVRLTCARRPPHP